jgi:type I restriction enzyme S subunit
MDKLPKGWKIVNWSDITLKIGDVDHKMPKENIDGYPYISPRDFRPNNKIDFTGAKKISKEDYIELSKKIKPEKGDIIFARYGTIGENRFVETEMDFLASYSCAIIKHDLSKVLPEFSFYYSISPQVKLEIEKYINKATQPNIGIQSISKFLFPLPPLSEQARIVYKLDALFGRIDQSIALLEENIRHTKALIASVLDEVFGGGTISLSELCLINPKKSEIRGTEENTQVSFLPMADLNEYQMYFQVKQIKKLSEVYSGYTYFRDNDVLVAKVTPCFENGKAGIARNLQNSIGFGSSEYHVIRAKNKVLPEWIYYSIMTTSFRDEGVNNMTGSSGLKRVPPKFIEEWKIKAPAIEEQKKTIEKIQVLDKNLNEIISAQQSKLTYLKALKSSLLDRAFKGDL